MRMHRLRFMKFYSPHYSKGNKKNDKVHLCEGLELLPDELRYLHWHRYPLRCLPSKFDPENLVELQMHHSNVEHLWNENRETLPTSYVVFPGNWNSQHSFIYYNCLKLDANAQLRIQVTARGTASMEDHLEVPNFSADGYIEGYSVSFCFPGNEIPES
ncbi:hypothetical protein Dsin_001176 [Dipteronia sinensis]|uniref:Uncharacterized protein n=1 Tax=Dipteronia sinensis TaxID=43782 RepID=A0AAE0B4T3_9ROSI|nr:hypothetical protein Dsin_001176 [Dipteronia sinensis]